MPPVDPLIRAHECDPRPLRRPLAELVEEEGESRAQPFPWRGTDPLHDLLSKHVAEQAASVQYRPDSRTNRFDIFGVERRVNHPRRIGPCGQASVARADNRAPGCEPERQLLGRVKMKRSAHGPGLDQRSLLPQGCSYVGPRRFLEPGRELQLGRCLDLSVHAAQSARNVDEPVGARPLVERRTRHSARPHVIPADLRHGADGYRRLPAGEVLHRADAGELAKTVP